jgi:hypothetical protein
LLAEAREAAALLMGDAEAEHLVTTRPAGIVTNAAPEALPKLPRRQSGAAQPGFWKWLRRSA